MNYINNEQWKHVGLYTNDVELREYMLTGYGEVEVLPHTELSLLDTKRKKYKVLDFGCGIGRNFKYFKEFSSELHGYDLDIIVDRCKDLCKEEIDLLTGDWSEIQKNKYDIVIASFVFQSMNSAKAIKLFLKDLAKITSLLYVTTRCYIDGPEHENIAKVIQDDSNFEIVMENCNIEQFAKAEHPSEAHAEFICRSKNESRPINEMIEPNFKTSLDHGGQFVYRSYADAIKDVKDWCNDLPEVSAVCGIPRSGSLLAAVISQYRNIPLLTMDGLLNDNFCWRPSISRSIAKPNGPILVVDDTCWSGSSLKRTKSYLKNRGTFIYGCLYINEDREDDIDHFYGVLPSVFHTCEWSLLRDHQSGAYLCDLDGVFCPDHDIGIEDGSLEYVEHLKTVKPTVYLPQYPLMKIVTARLEKYRGITEDWLALHKIRYKQLIMSPYGSEEERFTEGGFGRWKAGVYRDCPEAALFIESEHAQAAEIYEQTERPVFCMDTMTMFGGGGIDVPC